MLSYTIHLIAITSNFKNHNYFFQNSGMYKKAVYIFVFFAALIVQSSTVMAQLVEQQNDTFFLAKKKGLLGRFGKSISRNNVPDEPPQKLYNPFLKFKGKIIRSVILFNYDFGSNICDTCTATSDFGTRISNIFHKSSTASVIHNNLFFKTGDKIYPYLLADNERYLRELVYLRDARIVVEYVEGGVDSVDVLVLTQDIFSIGININISSSTRGRVELRDENFFGQR